MDKTIPLEPDGTYHLYNRSMGKERLFLNHRDYHDFMRRYIIFLSPLCVTLSYCLMPNHFHVLIRMKEEQEIEKELEGTLPEKELPIRVSKRFSNFFNSYAKATNILYERKGPVFCRPFKRKRVENLEYFRKLVHYIHYNPVEAGLCEKPKDWPYSSYHLLAKKKESPLEIWQVIDHFGDLENFYFFHKGDAPT